MQQQNGRENTVKIEAKLPGRYDKECHLKKFLIQKGDTINEIRFEINHVKGMEELQKI